MIFLVIIVFNKCDDDDEGLKKALAQYARAWYSGESDKSAVYCFVHYSIHLELWNTYVC